MSLSVLDRVAELPKAKRLKWVRAQPEIVQRDIIHGQCPWHIAGRPEQFMPGGYWRWWLILAGRGWGKSRTGAETAAYWARTYPGARVSLVAISFSDGRDVMVEGDSGLLSVLKQSELRGGTVENAWNRSLGELYLANGSRFKIYSSERPRQLRGPAAHFAWGDELTYWNDADKGTAQDSTFSNLNIHMRLKARPGWPEYHAKGILTCTPRRSPILKVPDEIVKDKPHQAGLLQRPPGEVIVTRGRTSDNVHNLDEDYKRAVIDPLEGTSIGRQELDGEMLDDVEGALWTQKLIDEDRRKVGSEPPMGKKVLAFDPAGGGGIGHDEHGLIVAGATGTRENLRLWVLSDQSFNGTPTEAARRAILTYAAEDCDMIVYEKNQGQDWIPDLFDSTYKAMFEAREISIPMPRLEPVSATRSKEARARPQVSLYEQHRVHHVGVFGTLEGQMTSWVPMEKTGSPDRLDALVWALSWLWDSGPAAADVASAAGRERRGRRPGQASTRMAPTYGDRSRR